MAPLHNIQAINIGWELTRDVGNILFIFMLLVIAIATILRLESYGAKKLLAGLIIMALLVNFSLVIARTVVDASNLLGITFVRAMYPVQNQIMTITQISKLRGLGTGAPAAPTNPAFKVDPDVPTAIAISGNAAIFPPTQDPLQQALGSGANPLDAAVGEFFIQSLIFILQLIAAYVFVALAVLYIVRTVALILIFVLAPFGFVFFAIPATRKYASEWWSQLFNWSFFFPASAFLLYITFQWGTQMASFNIEGNQILNAALVFNYVAVIVFLLMSLMVGKKMGIIGAATAISLGVAARKKTVGWVGRQSLKPVARGSDAFLNSKAAKLISRTPLIGGIASQVLLRPAALAVSARNAQAKKEADRFKNLSAGQAATMMRTASTDVQAAAFDAMSDTKKRKFIDAVRQNKGEAGVTKFGSKMKRYNLDDDVSAASGDLHTAMQILHDKFADLPAPPPADHPLADEYRQKANDFLGKLSDQQIKNLNANTISENPYFKDYFFRNARNFNDVTNTRDQINAISKVFKEEFPDIHPEDDPEEARRNAAQIVREKYGNETLARQFETGVGINLILRPDTVGIRSRRGQINVQQGGTATTG